MTTVNTVKVQGGADYAMVVNRVHRFVEDHETGQIHTEIVKDENGHVIFKAYALIAVSYTHLTLPTIYSV